MKCPYNNSLKGMILGKSPTWSDGTLKIRKPICFTRRITLPWNSTWIGFQISKSDGQNSPTQALTSPLILAECPCCQATGKSQAGICRRNLNGGYRPKGDGIIFRC